MRLLTLPALLTPLMLLVAGCDRPGTSPPRATAEPTKVEPQADAHAAAGDAVPRDEANPPHTPPPAKGGY
jgi:hypothetical protein